MQTEVQKWETEKREQINNEKQVCWQLVGCLLQQIVSFIQKLIKKIFMVHLNIHLHDIQQQSNLCNK